VQNYLVFTKLPKCSHNIILYQLHKFTHKVIKTCLLQLLKAKLKISQCSTVVLANLYYRLLNIQNSLVKSVVALLESMTRLVSIESQFLVTLFLPNDSTRVTSNDSRFESESFLQNFRLTDCQTHFVCIQRNVLFVLQWLSVLVQTFGFDCVF